MNKRDVFIALAVAVVILIAGYVFIDSISWLGYTESAVLYLSAVIGAGCYWIGRNK